MSGTPDRQEWRYLQIALGILALIAVAEIAGWKVHDIAHPRPTRLERFVFCLKDNDRAAVVVPAGDPISATAGAGSFRTRIEGNGVTVALASSVEQAIEIERNYHAIGGELRGRLERRDRTVYLWEGSAEPTQRQAMYDCDY
jgi:hypothetical protein